MARRLLTIFGRESFRGPVPKSQSSSDPNRRQTHKRPTHRTRQIGRRSKRSSSVRRSMRRRDWEFWDRPRSRVRLWVRTSVRLRIVIRQGEIIEAKSDRQSNRLLTANFIFRFHQKPFPPPYNPQQPPSHDQQQLSSLDNVVRLPRGPNGQGFNIRR